MEKVFTLKAEAKDLKLFEMVAKKLGISLKKSDKTELKIREEIFFKLTKRGYDTGKAAKIVGLTDDMISEIVGNEIKAYRKERRKQECE